MLTMGLMGAGVGTFGILKISESNAHLNAVLESSFIPYQDLKNISNVSYTIVVEMEKLAKKEVPFKIAENKINSELANVEILSSNFQPDSKNMTELRQYKQIQEEIQNLKIDIELWLEKVSLNKASTSTSYSDLLFRFKDLQDNLEILMDSQIKKARIIQEENQANFARSKISFALILLIGVTVSIIISLIILIGIKAYIRSTSRLIHKIASGDLSTKLERRGAKDFGEIQENLGLLSDKFTEILELSQTAANNINITSQEMSSNSQMIANGSSQQAASVEEIAASMEEISSRIAENTDNTLSTQKISNKLVEDIENGSKNVSLTVDAIQSIASKISIIGDIAFQTNILALNAAVEAARAGEHGKGFGVVAVEVGKLAERSKTAAIEIDTLSKSGVNLALNSNKLLTNFVSEITQTSALISNITEANLEQNAGIKEVNNAIQMLNQITQQNAASSEEMATISEQLASQAQTLKESIEYFILKKQAKSENSNQKFLSSAKNRNK